MGWAARANKRDRDPKKRRAQYSIEIQPADQPNVNTKGLTAGDRRAAMIIAGAMASLISPTRRNK